MTAGFPPPTRAGGELAPTPVGAVVFDLGNVLIRWDPVEAIAQGVGRRRAEAFVADPSFGFAAWNAANDYGREFAEAEATAIRTHPHFEDEILSYRRHFDHSMLGAIDGTVAILRELHAAGVPLFALTNWSAELFPQAQERFDFLELFEDIVVSGEEGIGKPDPEIYEILEERIRHVSGLDDSIFIDDSPANVMAALAVGLDAIRFTDPESLREDLVVRGLPLRLSG